jgi:hypothetical protein
MALFKVTRWSDTASANHTFHPVACICITVGIQGIVDK